VWCASDEAWWKHDIFANKNLREEMNFHSISASSKKIPLCSLVSATVIDSRWEKYWNDIRVAGGFRLVVAHLARFHSSIFSETFNEDGLGVCFFASHKLFNQTFDSSTH
jgi:hypothetical protein